jgi:hypothetical protein
MAPTVHAAPAHATVARAPFDCFVKIPIIPGRQRLSHFLPCNDFITLYTTVRSSGEIFDLMFLHFLEIIIYSTYTVLKIVHAGFRPSGFRYS